MKPKSKKSAASKKPTTISIHGEGVDIDASFTDQKDGKKKRNHASFSDLLFLIVEGFSRQVSQAGAGTAAPGPTASPTHDFDAVQRVIEIGDPMIMRAMIELAGQRLDQQGEPRTGPSVVQ